MELLTSTGTPPVRRRLATAPVEAADLERFEQLVGAYLRGELSEERFRIFRLSFGVYGQRQGGRNQMVRVKLPQGAVSPEQLKMLGHVADTYSRGWGHLTTRQCVQFHFVPLEQVSELLWDLASVGLTTREACGDTVRNVTMCPLAGECPGYAPDVSWWAQAAFRHFLRHPYAQRLPRKFKIAFSGCEQDCAGALFNDIGVIGVVRSGPDGRQQAGFRVFIGGGLAANPHPAVALEDFTPRHELLLTLEAVLRTFDHYGNRDNKLRARMKWLVDTIGIEELRQRILRERELLIAVPAPEMSVGERPCDDEGSDARPITGGDDVLLVHPELGDVTSEQFRGLANLAERLGTAVRTTVRQSFVLRGMGGPWLDELHSGLEALGWRAAHPACDVVSCPGADTCSLAVTRSRGVAHAICRALEEAGLPGTQDVRINVSGCTNSCGQHHVADIGLFGIERRAHGRAAPGYQMLLGGHLGGMTVVFGQKATKLPAKRVPEAVVEVVRRFTEERRPTEPFASWLERAGGARGVGGLLSPLDEFPEPGHAPELYIDYDETGPYVAETGAGECVGS